MHVIHQDTLEEPVRESALSEALLVRVASGEQPPTLRLYRPAPTVAFGRLDKLRPGFGRAAAAARERGFTPILRSPGGHAAAYDAGTVGFDLVMRTERLLVGVQDRFLATSEALARELAALGVDARVGAVPGEYCAGDYSINAGGTRKLVGTAQRAVRGATLLGGFVTVGGADRLRAVLEPVYAALEIDWDPRSLGAIEDDVPHIGLADVERAVTAALAPEGVAAALDDTTAALASELEPRHALDAA